jgi:hypothetical protein
VLNSHWKARTPVARDDTSVAQNCVNRSLRDPFSESNELGLNRQPAVVRCPK